MNGSINCRTFRKHCVEILEMEGDSRRSAELRSHRERCPECARFFDEMGETLQALEPASELAASAHFAERVINRVEEIESQERLRTAARRSLRDRSLRLSLAAAILAIVAAAVAVISDWHTGSPPLPNEERRGALTCRETAKAFLRACADENWTEAVKFWPAAEIPPEVKTYLGGLEIISIGETCRCPDTGQWYVPYEARLKQGETRKADLVLRDDNPAKRWILDGRGLIREARRVSERASNQGG